MENIPFLIRTEPNKRIRSLPPLADDILRIFHWCPKWCGVAEDRKCLNHLYLLIPQNQKEREREMKSQIRRHQPTPKK